MLLGVFFLFIWCACASAYPSYSVCRDIQSAWYCSSNRWYCRSYYYMSYMSQYCRRTCNLCVCQDTHTNCRYWKSVGYCSNRSYYYSMLTYCQWSCGWCVTTTRKPATRKPIIKTRPPPPPPVITKAPPPPPVTTKTPPPPPVVTKTPPPPPVTTKTPPPPPVVTKTPPPPPVVTTTPPPPPPVTTKTITKSPRTFMTNIVEPGKPNTEKPTKPFQNCGKNKISSGRIIGGTEAAANSWVWQASLYYYGSYICGGVLITRNHVLTAAHCVLYKDADGFTVTLGDHKRDAEEGAEQSTTVKDVLYHHDYNPEPVDNDIAILTMSSPVDLNDNVNIVCLPKNLPDFGSICYITGWGYLSAKGEAVNILNEALMPYVNETQCATKNQKFKQSLFTNNMICGGYEKNSLVSGCHGDSGGPYVCKTEQSNWELQGIVSWGSPTCDASQRYTVFTKVLNYLEWIEKHAAE